MDNFHFKQALMRLTTKSNKDVYATLLYLINSNNKNNFNLLVEQFKDLNLNIIKTIENKQNYILNNWKERQTYLVDKYIKCFMEFHISHILSDLFTSRPKAYSENGLRKLLKLRLLKINANKIIFPTDIKINKYLNDFYNTGIDTFDYIQKEEISFI